MRIEFSIPLLPLLPNRLLGAHWWVRSSHAKKWRQLVWLQTMYQNCRPEHPFSKAEITFTRCSPYQCDYDGLVGSFKPVLDALVKCELLEDDSPQHVNCSYLWEKTPRAKQGIRILIRDDGQMNDNYKLSGGNS